MRERINLKQRLGLDNPESEALIERFTEQMDLAQRLYDLRTERGLSQADAAKLVRASQSVINSIEESDYDADLSRQILEKLTRALDADAARARVPGTAVGAA